MPQAAQTQADGALKLEYHCTSVPRQYTPLVNWQLAKYLAGTALSTFADRLAQIQLLSIVVLSGPAGEGLGSNTVSLLLPFVLLSYALGAQADRFSKRKSLVVISILRVLIVLVIPTILVTLGAAGPIIPLCIFILCSCIAFCSTLNFAIAPELTNKFKKANACILLTMTAATLAAIAVSPFISEIWLPYETLRFAAIVYFIAMFAFWTMRTTSENKRPGNDLQQVMLHFRSHKLALGFFRLAAFLHFGNIFVYSMLLIFSLQNTQLNNTSAVNLFASIATGFAAGAILMLGPFRSVRASRLISNSTVVAAILCGAFGLFGSLDWLKYFLIALGTAHATILITMDSITQSSFAPHIRGKVYGAMISLASAAVLMAIVLVEQVTIRYSAVTIIRFVCLGYGVFTILLGASWPSFRRFVIFAPKLATSKSWCQKAHRA